MGFSAGRQGVLGTLLILSAGCGFSVGGADTGHDAAVDVPGDLDSPQKAYWTLVAGAKAGVPSVAIYPFDGTAFSAPCTPHPTTYAVRDLLRHPSLPFVFAVESGFHALSLSCTAMSETGVSDVAGVRAIQQITFDPASNVGFFTADGPLAVGVFRFSASSSTAAPTVAGSANAPSNAGPLALDLPGHHLFAAGSGFVAGYALDASLALPATYTSALGCSTPSHALLSGDYLLELCADSPDIRRYTKSPFAFDQTVGAIGAIDRGLALSGDRAIVARASPPDLAVVDLAGGTPTWTAGPMLGSRATALAISADGEVVATARAIDATSSEVTLWRLSGTSLTLMIRQTVAGDVTALAVTTPGT